MRQLAVVAVRLKFSGCGCETKNGERVEDLRRRKCEIIRSLLLLSPKWESDKYTVLLEW